MSQSLELEKQLKLVAKTGSYVVGRREVSNALKGTKLLVWSTSANVPQTILDECKNLSVPAIKFGGNPVELGRACGIPFRVSVIALKAAGDADLSGFVKATDYYSGVIVAPPKQPERVETKSAREGSGAKSKKEVATKKKETGKTRKPKESGEASEAAGKEPTKKKKGSDSEKTTSKKESDTSEKMQKKTTKKKAKKSEDEEENEE